MKRFIPVWIFWLLTSQAMAADVTNLGPPYSISSTASNIAVGVNTFPAGNGIGGNTGNTALGIGALQNMTAKSNNTAIGANTLNAMSTGLSNTAVGQNALDGVTTTNFNVGFGDNAGRAITTGTGNTAIGHGSFGQDDTTPAVSTANYNTGAGGWSLQEITTGGANSCFGMNACSDITTGQNNTAVGQSALFGGPGSTATNVGNAASQNTAIGTGALQVNTANSMTAVGFNALKANTSGSLSTAIGYQSLSTSITDVRNTALGYNALQVLNGGPDNTAIGETSMAAATTANANTAIGSNSALTLLSGTKNLVLGQYVASTTLTTGSRNILIGTDTNCDTTASGTNDTFTVCASSGATHLLTGNRAAGALAMTNNGTLAQTGLATFAAQINVTSMTQTSAAQSGTVCYNVGTGAITYDATLGCLTSSFRFKTDILAISSSEALKTTLQLSPVSFRKKEDAGGDVDHDVQVGFVAEDVAKIDERLTARGNDGEVRGVRYQQMTAILAGAIKELKAENDNLRACNGNWKCRLFGWQ
jgi:trimeric autotransporter adhesin